ncbi:hypothetical protein LPC10_22220 [Methylorubrum sp. B1-46]|uniref:hypothetical protein n=1 Tax=Methylorubrum sp. B1-46 TaxID=2897334 RepID=UPI001E5A46E6|nr:hypothetical protein [Methylorubrum sp. B1-46]UGB25573.1 hypothetical protein LPC10_22220 [Methylorubrum sp. B1-46]
MAPASRRGFLRGLTTLPLIGGGVTLIGSASAANVPSDLARACDAAVARLRYVNENDEPDECWPDERITAENMAFDAALERSATEKASCLGDLSAKARLLLCEFRENLGGDLEANAGERALMAFLREMAEEGTLCA